MVFTVSRLGQWTEDREFKVDGDRTIAYARATNDTNAKHLSGEYAPPVFAVVPMLETKVLEEAQSDIVPDEFAMHVLHGEQDIFLHEPIVPGSTLRLRACAIGISVKKTGTTLVAKIDTRNEKGVLINEQYLTGFFRGAVDGVSVGEVAPEHRLTEELRESPVLTSVTQHVDDDQTYRYSAASGDTMPIHLDDAVARSVGLPGIIAHGLCTMAMNSQVIIAEACTGDPLLLKRLAIRLTKPVLPGEDITTRLWAVGRRNGLEQYAFETNNSRGERVVTDGCAEVKVR